MLSTKIQLSLALLSLASAVFGRPTETLDKRQGFALKNGQDAIALK